MKKENINYLIATLSEANDYVSAKELATQMHVTTRSIRNYVSEINSIYKKEVVFASHDGYKWLGAESFVMAFSTSREIPDTPEKREWYILRKLAYNNTAVNDKRITLTALSEQLFISERSLEKDIEAVRKRLNEYGLKLHIKNEIISINGSELEIRHLIYDCINHYSSSIVNTKELQKSFPLFPVEKLSKTLRTLIENCALKCDSVHFYGLLTYIIIQFYRVKNTNVLKKNEINIDALDSYKEYDLAVTLADYITKELSLTIPTSEIEYYAMLLISNCHNEKYLYPQFEQTGQLVKEQFFHVSKHTNISFDEDNIVEKSADLIERFKIRWTYNTTVFNPLSSAIRNSAPIIHDRVAWIISDYYKEWGLRPKRSDITELTLLINSYMRKRGRTNEKISCALICPDYYDCADFIIEKLESHYGNVISVDYTLGIDDINDIPKCDMIVSLINEELSRKYVYVSPALMNTDYNALRREITKIEQKRHYQSFYQYLTAYSSEALFERNHYFKSRHEAIEYICTILKEKEFVGDDFLDSVLLREHSDSTSYHNMIAIPHSTSGTINKNAIYIILNDKPIIWGNRRTNLIVLVAMAHESLIDFTYLYNSLIQTFANRKNMNQLLGVKTYCQFMSEISELSKNI